MIRETSVEARIIVIILGSTAGLRAEYRMLAEIGAMGKVAAVFPPVAPAERAVRWATFAEAALPATRSTVANVSRVIIVQTRTDGSLRLLTCEWQDEECYVLAMRCCL